MDKKAKKKVEVLRKKVTKLQQLLVAAKSQMDDPNDVVELQDQLDSCRAEITKLKES